LVVLVPAATTRPRRIEDLLGPELMQRLDRLDVLSRKIFAGKLPGERRSKKRGFSVEFDDFRNYVPGDDLRHIDWNVFARMDRFFIKIFREEEDLALHLVVDASASMDAGNPGKLHFAQRIAMALGYIGLVNQNRVVATILGAPGRPAVQQLAPVRGRRSIRRIAKFLIENAFAPEGYAGGASALNFNAALRTLGMSRKGKGVLLLVSDFLVREDYRQGLNYLAAAGPGGGYDVYVLQVLSPGELEPEREAEGTVVGDLRLMDVETGAAAEVTISSALLQRYKQRLAAHIEGVRAACAARGMSHLMVRSDEDVGRLLLDYLRRRGMLG
jgi:uncharacterized protein (DUF58 family)